MLITPKQFVQLLDYGNSTVICNRHSPLKKFIMTILQYNVRKKCLFSIILVNVAK